MAYEAHEWESKELISAAKLNQIENALAELGAAVDAEVVDSTARSDISTINSSLTSLKNRVTELDVGEITPQMFGAAGDGETDDTDALAEALAYAKANNKVLVIPPGTYICTSGLSFDSVKVEGVGKPTLLATACAAQINQSSFSFSGDDLSVRNMVFETSTSEAYSITRCYKLYGALFEGCDFIIDGVTCKAIFDLFSSCYDVTVRNCYFNNNIPAGDEGGVWVRALYSGETTERIVFDGCTFDHSTSADELLAVWDSSGTVKDITIQNCVFNSSYASGISHAHHFSLVAENLVFRNNVINYSSEDGQTSIFKCAYSKDSAYVAYDSVLIEDCTFNLDVSLSSWGFVFGKATIQNCTINDAADLMLCMLYQTDSNGDYMVPIFKGDKINANIITTRALEMYDCIVDCQNTESSAKMFHNPCILHNCRFLNINNTSIMIQMVYDGGYDVEIVGCTFEGTAGGRFLFSNTAYVNNIILMNNYIIGKSLYGIGVSTGIITRNTFEAITSLPDFGGFVGYNAFASGEVDYYTKSEIDDLIGEVENGSY